MKLRPEQLDKHLREPLKAIYVLTGDEPLLLQECADAIRQGASAQGYSARERVSVERYFDWSDTLANSNALSLFSERKVLDIRFSNKPDAAASAALLELAARPPEDTILLIQLPKLEAAALKSKWLSALDEAGVVITLFAIDAAAFPGWLQARAQRLGLRLDADALRLLAERTEGNLLAAAQTLEKLCLLGSESNIDIDAVASTVSDSARYSVFDLADAVLLGDATRVARLVLGLEREGQAESVVLWALQKDLRSLTQIAELLSQQGNVSASSQLLAQMGFWSKRQGPALVALKRLSLVRLQRLSSGLLDIDRAIKGQSAERAWDSLLRLAMAMAGRPLFMG